MEFGGQYLTMLALQEERESKLLEALTKRKEWMEMRIGRFTASDINRLLTYAYKDVLSSGAITYVNEKVIEHLTKENTSIKKTEDMKRGNELEPEAISEMEKYLGVQLQNTGDDQFFYKFGDHAGATPDGQTDTLIVEVKCLSNKVHFEYLESIEAGKTLKEINSKYYWQVKFQMMCSKKETAFFGAYNPSFPGSSSLIVLPLRRDEKEEEFMKRRLNMAIQLKLQKINKYES